jgi:hypothetical protein
VALDGEVVESPDHQEEVRRDAERMPADGVGSRLGLRGDAVVLDAPADHVENDEAEHHVADHRRQEGVDRAEQRHRWVHIGSSTRRALMCFQIGGSPPGQEMKAPEAFCTARQFLSP